MQLAVQKNTMYNAIPLPTKMCRRTISARLCVHARVCTGIMIHWAAGVNEGGGGGGSMAYAG
jgi:hypothetical protein